MVRSYLKYEHGNTFGLVTSATSNVVWSHDDEVLPTHSGFGGGKAIVGANEEVLCWDIKKGELLSRWRQHDLNASVTAIARSAVDPDIYAVGYDDGSIRIWDSRMATVVISFNGHKTAITCLVFDRAGVRLASGSKDTDIILWDLVAEVGLFKLRGHKNQITGLRVLQPLSEKLTNINGENGDHEATLDGDDVESSSSGASLFLLSTSKEALVKLWDLNAQHCMETHVTQSNGECWALGVSSKEDGFITAGNDGELKLWSIDTRGLGQAASQLDPEPGRKFLQERGSIYRQGKDRTLDVKFHTRGTFFAAHGSEKAIEMWRIRSDLEVEKSLVRKKKRRREKAAQRETKPTKDHDRVEDDPDDAEDAEDASVAMLSDMIVPYVVVRTSGKVKAFDWAGGKSGKTLRLLASTTNNQLEIYEIPISKEKSKSEEPPDYSQLFSIEMPGHRTDVRSLALSSDDRMLASASNGSLKVWNIRMQSCMRTLECGYALCSSFLPGDKIVVVGNRNGELELFDIASSSLIETVKAHDGPVWTLHVHPDGKSMVTGSADKSAKFWSFEIIQEEIPGTKRTTPRLKLVHTRTLKLSDDILSARFSPDSRLLAVALLDNTVKVFFVDSLKLFLNLYGHKLPVLSLDISYDSKLIVTCSADKNVRIWGLDFGDCHKALFAHQDSILQVAFVPHNQDGNGHHFFSAGKDRMVKYWDGDRFEQIQRFQGHHGEIWAIATSRTGDFLATASHDKSIRIWNQTDEQIFLEEEREKELEELYENTLTTSLEPERTTDDQADVTAAGKQTTETLMAGERIAEALEISIPDLALMEEWTLLKATQPKLAPPPRHPIFRAHGPISAEEHVLRIVQKIPAAALQDALLVLPFERATALLTFIRIWAERGWHMPLACRILFFLLKTHHKQLVASKTMRPMLDAIRARLRLALRRQKDEMGFNLAALRFVAAQVRARGSRSYVDEETWDEDERKGRERKKRAFVEIA